jgi:hypothetical protein
MRSGYSSDAIDLASDFGAVNPISNFNYAPTYRSITPDEVHLIFIHNPSAM